MIEMRDNFLAQIVSRHDLLLGLSEAKKGIEYVAYGTLEWEMTPRSG
jgi:hypothetical protein